MVKKIIKKKRLAPPKGIHLTTWEWLVQSKLKQRKKYYRQPNFQDEGQWNLEPKGFNKKIHGLYPNKQDITGRPAFVAIIPEGRVWGPKGAIIAPDNKLLWDVSREYFKEPSNHSIFQKKKLPPLKETDETVAVLTYDFSPIYYHWMFDVLPRLELLKYMDSKVDKLVFNSHDLSFQRETLTLLGIPREMIINCHGGLHLRAKKLVATFRGSYSWCMPKWSCQCLRNRFLVYKDNGNSQGLKRIFISREQARARKVLNEVEVMNLLESYGFTKVVLESLTVLEQINLFSNAEVIISPHGSGLTNLVFSNPGTKVLELLAPSYIHFAFWILCNHLQLDYHYLVGEGSLKLKEPPHFHYKDDILVSLSNLNTMLKMMNL